MSVPTCTRQPRACAAASNGVSFVGEVVMKQEMTPLLLAAKAKGCPYQLGTDMLYEMIPAYLEFFGFGTATPEELRGVSKVPHEAPAEAGA